MFLRSLMAFSLVAALGACGPNDHGGDDDGGGDPSKVDKDQDGYNVSMDCNDQAPMQHPGAEEICNGIDDDCSGAADEPFDGDGDGHGNCGQDCDDSDPTTYLGAMELHDGKDNDCDSKIDNHLPDVDDDGDGFTEQMGDCNDEEAFVNPGAVEVQTRADGTPEGVDNDCNGQVDEPPQTCDGGLNPANALHLARAMDLCNNVTMASVVAVDARGHGIDTAFGTYAPHLGGNMLALSSGLTAAPVPGTQSYDTYGSPSHAHPEPKGDPMDGCGKADDPMVYDYTELSIELDVPSNAKSFSFDFNFMSSEYPEWVCKAYDDTFLAELTSVGFNGNISFDSKGKPVTVNSGFFTTCQPGSEPPGKPAGSCIGNAELAGTGHDGTEGGGTGWLTTTAPVTPGEHIKLRLIIFDEGDPAYDSQVLIDNFRWLGEAVDGPITVGREAVQPPLVSPAAQLR